LLRRRRHADAGGCIVAKQVKQSIAPVSFGERTIEGYDHPLQVFAVERIDVAYPDWLDGACRD
jgi:class 3 adenylate cyclase